MSFLSWSRNTSPAPSDNHTDVYRPQFVPRASIDRELLGSASSTPAPSTPGRDISPFVSAWHRHLALGRQDSNLIELRSESTIVDTETTRAQVLAGAPNVNPNNVQSSNISNIRPAVDRKKIDPRWQRAADTLRKRQEETRGFWQYKNRLADARVKYSFDELWQDAVAEYGMHFMALKKSIFLLSSHKVYNPIPLATIRIRPNDGHIVIRKDVRLIMRSGICRTEKLTLQRFHSLISFKFNDVSAMYAKVVPGGPLLILFMAQYEGPVVFYFKPIMAPRALLVLMQTQFIEKLHSAVDENPLGRYAMEILQFAESQQVEEDVCRKRYTFDASLLRMDYPSYFDSMAYPQGDGGSETDDSEYGDYDEPGHSDRDSDSQPEIDVVGSTTATPVPEQRPPAKRTRYSRSRSYMGQYQNAATQDSYMQKMFHAGTGLSIGRTDTAFMPRPGSLETKKQREQEKLSRLLAQRKEIEDLIKEQSKVVDGTSERFEEIEDRISKLNRPRSDFHRPQSRRRAASLLGPLVTMPTMPTLPEVVQAPILAALGQSEMPRERDIIDLENIFESSKQGNIDGDVVEERLARVIHKTSL